MVKFKKIASSLPKPVKELPSDDSGSDASGQPIRKSIGCEIPPSSSVLEFIDERFSEKYKIAQNLHPDALPFDPDEEEVFYLQVPKNYPVDGLVGKKINLEKKTKLGAGCESSSKSYEIVKGTGTDLPKQVVTQVASNGQRILTTIAPVGIFLLRESVNEIDYGDDLEDYLNKFDEAENGVVMVPTDLKVRHPLLGADFTQELASRAQALISVNKRIKKEQQSPKKAKKRKAPKQVEVEPQPEESEEVTEAETRPKPEKRRKKKSMETSADLQWLANI